ncbi:NAD-dependent epimerase/dehydratase family protein [Natronorubrum daqingense]|uniref:UDP-glucose 4-epimerase n=1 Tax=Natronorubrum daqingense TaxID=588898 RepID=A0A1N7FLZ4_9EURY|nr:NAD-dependent epimerase/dehydratase family protein [Natronorubrum daqingense]APX98390.1 UDP-glucose 4-epimerase [Natronorubrum daqingense]SIS01418.1 UDP-glucose 4-epimerase [Natronorubrum daqingense]
MTTGQPTGRTILITGGAGFIGSHLADALVADNDVRVLDNLTSGERANVPDDATLIEGDLRDDATLERATDGVDLIFHKAALVSVQGSVEAPQTSHEINVDATLEVLEAAREEDARVVLASSAAIYGHPERVPIREGDAKTPSSPYGLDKLSIDHYARQYHDLYGLETVALRYFNAYGPGQTAGDYSGVISIFCEQALRDEPITVHGDGEQTRDFVFVDDIVQANLEAATTDRVGTAYNVGTGTSVTVRDLAETIADVTDSGSEIAHTEGRTGDIRHSEADITTARTALGYEPTVSLRDGLERTVAWLRKRE